MATTNETVLKVGGLTYTGGILDARNWSITELEMKNFFLIRLIFGGKRSHKILRTRNLVPLHCVITDKRFIIGNYEHFNNTSVGKPVNLTKGGNYLGIPFADIINFKIIRAGTSITAGEFEIETKNGSYGFVVKKVEEWEAVFNEALAKREAEPVQVNYCSKCGEQIDESLNVCPYCGFIKSGESPISEITKSKLTKMWLFGLFGTLGLHFYSSKRQQRGMLRTICGIALWFLFIVFLYGTTQTEGLTRLAIATGVALIFLPIIDLIIIRIGKFRDVYGKYVTK